MPIAKISEDLYAFLWVDQRSNNANTYFINGTKKILVDPGHYHLFGHVRDNLSSFSLNAEEIDLVIVTHAHPDHLEAVRAFSESSTLIALHPAEREFIRTKATHIGFSDFEPDVLLQEGELRVGDLIFQVIHSPGHSPGSISLYWPEKKALFSGDVIFSQGLGRTDLPGGSGQELKESIRTLSRLAVHHLLPGHGEVVSGRDRVKANFENVETVWFAYI
ncbi:MAG: MBL fold metallo-hydrolase [Proteobacteria bacterium]|nr:MBL fold metallo-hydrolase [Pseudomonadota bacterium]